MSENKTENYLETMVCLLIDDGRSPIGQVVHQDEKGLVLHHFSFVTGFCIVKDNGEDYLEYYPFAKIERVVKGERMTAEQIKEQTPGYSLKTCEELAAHPAGYWNTLKLGSWQTMWKAARG